MFRGEPLKDKYVLVTIKPHKEWQLARLSGHNNYQNNVSQITDNVLKRFLDPKPFGM